MARDITQEEVWEAYRLKSVVDSLGRKAREVSKAVDEHIGGLNTAFETSVKEAEKAREKTVESAETKRTRAIATQTALRQKAAGETTSAQTDLDDFQSQLNSETGIMVTLPGGGGSSPPTTVRI